MKNWHESTLEVFFIVPNSDTFGKQRMANLKEEVSDNQFQLIHEAFAAVSNSPVAFLESTATYRHHVEPSAAR